MFLGVSVLAIGLGAIAFQLQRAREQQAALAWLRASGGSATYEYEYDAEGAPVPGAEPPGPRWIRKLLGNDVFAEVDHICLPGDVATAEAFQRLRAVRGSWFLSIHYPEKAALQHAGQLSSLRELHLHGVRGGSGLVHLRNLPNLRVLGVYGDELSDTAIHNLRGLKHLERLIIGGPITDEALPALQGMERLEELIVYFNESVTEESLQDLQTHLPKAVIRLNTGRVAEVNRHVPPAEALALFEQGKVLEEEGKLTESIQAFTKAIQLDADYADAFCLRAYAWRRKGNPEAAIADFTRVLQLRPRSPHIF